MIEMTQPVDSTSVSVETVSASPPEILGQPMFMLELLTVLPGTVIPGNPPFKLKQGIIATIDRTSDGVVIASPMLDEEGYGESYAAAWADFLSSIRDKLASLTKREASLSPADKEVLGNLRESLIPA
jgi:hypothetical protein